MRFMGLMKADAASEAGEMPSDPSLFQRMGAFMQEVAEAGVLTDTDGLQPSSKGKRVKLADGKVTVVDGPFTESKELIASYALFNVKSMDDAVYWTTRFLEVIGHGECENPAHLRADRLPRGPLPARNASRRRRDSQDDGPKRAKAVASGSSGHFSPLGRGGTRLAEEFDAG